MQKSFLKGEKSFIGTEATNLLRKVVFEEEARQDNRAARRAGRAGGLPCRRRVRQRRLRLSKVVDVVFSTNNADGQPARATVGSSVPLDRAHAGRVSLPDNTETFAWDGLALVRRGDEEFVNGPLSRSCIPRA